MEVLSTVFPILILIAQLQLSHAVTCRASQCPEVGCETGQECQTCTCEDNYCIATFAHSGDILVLVGQGCMTGRLIANLENGCYWDGRELICQCNSDHCNDKSTDPIYPNGKNLLDCYGEQPHGSVGPNETPTCTGYACEVHTERDRERGSCVVGRYHYIY